MSFWDISARARHAVSVVKASKLFETRHALAGGNDRFDTERERGQQKIHPRQPDNASRLFEMIYVRE